MGSISLREFIRWLPDEASEPTSTLVVTSPGRHFVDIRVLRPETATGPGPTKEETIPWNRVDWLIAGTSSSWKGGSGEVTRGQWRHWISSRTTDTENVADEGDMYPQPNGTTLEKGIMLNPETGEDTEYEESWRDIEPLPTNSTKVRSVVLQLAQGDKVKGSVVLLGQYCQGLLRKGDQVSAERWEWSASDGWKRTVVIGEDSLPCSQVLQATSFEVGNTVQVGDDAWKAIEASGYSD